MLYLLSSFITPLAANNKIYTIHINKLHKNRDKKVLQSHSYYSGCDFRLCLNSSQRRFTLSEVAANWHEPVVPQRIMWPFISRANRQLCS